MERLCIHLIQVMFEREKARRPHGPSLAVHPRLDQLPFTQQPEVLRYSGLTDGESTDQLADGPFALAQETEDRTPIRFCEHLEDFHGGNISIGYMTVNSSVPVWNAHATLNREVPCRL